MALGLMKISTKDSSIRAEGLHKHGIYFGKKILNKRKEYTFPMLKLFSFKMERKFEFKDLGAIELYNDSVSF